MRDFRPFWLNTTASVVGALALVGVQVAFAAPADRRSNPAEEGFEGVTTESRELHSGSAEEEPIAEHLRVLLGAPLNAIVDDRQDRDALRTFYKGRNHAPVWTRISGLSDRSRAALIRLMAAERDGLDANDYPAPEVTGPPHDPEKLARAELILMSSLAKYARHAQSGRVNPSRISPNISVTPPVPESLNVLNTLAGADDVAGTLDGFNPPHLGFQKLKAKLRELLLSDQTPRRHKSSSNANAINSILSNMERWRWLPRDLGTSYVLVNIPDYRLDVVRRDRNVFQTRIVVGKQATPSPIFSDEIESVQVNPTWHVPQSIVQGQYLPALSRDPSVLRRMGLVVSRGPNGMLSVRQPPGPKNALGRLKVNFPNPFNVYLHDTPDKHLFAREQRAYSAGCMRVQNTEQFVAEVLSLGAVKTNYTEARLRSLYGSAEQWIALTSRVPIHLVYMNTYVNDSGQLVVRPDIYGYDARVKSALRGHYLVVTERSQRGSSIPPRAARVTRWVAQRPQSARMAQEPFHSRQRTPFGFFSGPVH